MMCRKFSYYFLQFCIISVMHLLEAEAKKLCSMCEMSTKSQLIKYCIDNNSTGHLQLQDSCCVNKTSDNSHVIIGVDLSNCSLTSIHGILTAETSLRFIMLEENPDLQIESSDFNGLTQLQYLSLPKGLQCPGGNNSWNSTKQTENTVVCKDEVDLCDKVSCPNTNSYCLMKGPGDVECLCKEGYHGYKCLRQGYFPTAVYTIILCSITVILCGYLWCIQRRKVKKL